MLFPIKNKQAAKPPALLRSIFVLTLLFHYVQCSCYRRVPYLHYQCVHSAWQIAYAHRYLLHIAIANSVEHRLHLASAHIYQLRFDCHAFACTQLEARFACRWVGHYFAHPGPFAFHLHHHLSTVTYASININYLQSICICAT
jgi:hypothetical protein